MPRPRITALVVLTVALQLTGAPAAFAEEGVTIDPASPSGTEYQLPVQRAREEAAGSGSSDLSDSPPASTPSGSGSGASSEPPLFGVGIVKRTKVGGAPAGDGTDKPAGQVGQDGKGGPPISATRKEQLAVAAGSGGGATLTLLGGAGMVVVLGGLAGVILRGRRTGL